MTAMRPCLLLAALLFVPACIRVDRDVAGTVGGLPETVLGEWQGTWTSVSPGMSGNGWVTLRLQRFQDLPVIRIDSNNPCLQPGAYSVEVRSREIVLTSGDARFEAEFAPDWRSLTGTYSCHDDHGIWQSAWSRELAPAGDLTGGWFGTWEPDPPTQGGGELRLVLQQTWVAGSLQVRGTVVVPDLSQDLPITSGEVQWDGPTFRLVLATDTSRTPFLVMTGSGDSSRMNVDPGRFLLGVPPGVLVGTGSWDALWLGR